MRLGTVLAYITNFSNSRKQSYKDSYFSEKGIEF